MEFENLIGKYPGCKDCKLVENIEAKLAKDPKMAGKHVVLTQCDPKLDFTLGLHNARFLGMVTEKGRLERLKKLNGGKEFKFQADVLVMKQYGNCMPLIRETAENTVDKIFRALRLE